MVPSRTAHTVLVLFAILALGLLVVIAQPLATGLFVAAVMAGAFTPLTDRLTSLLKGRRRLAAFLITLGLLIAVVGPFSALGAVLVPQLESGVAWLREALQNHRISSWIEHAPQGLRPLTERLWQVLPSSLEKLQESASNQGARAAALFANVLSSTGAFLFQGTMSFIAFYFLLIDGPKLVDWLNEAIPLKRGQVAELLHEFRRVTVTVLLSTLATGAVQATLALVGYLIARVPNALFFAFVTFLLSLVPVLGATSVVVAIAVVKVATGHTGAGILLLAWAAGVSTIDNVLKPLFMRGGVPIHGAVIFFALLGGIAAFGPIGFLAGPLAVTFLVAVVRMYQRDFGS